MSDQLIFSDTSLQDEKMRPAPRQLSFFESEATCMIMRAGGFVPIIKNVLRTVLDKSGLSRAQAVDKINATAAKFGKPLTQGRKKGITEATLDKWLNPNELEHVPGMYALHIFMLALDTMAPLEAWLAIFDCSIMRPEDKEKLELSRLAARVKRDTKRMKELEKKLWEDKE